MLSVVALMVLLLPVLLRTTTSQKLTSLSLGVHSSTSDLPPNPSGELEKLTVLRDASGYRIQQHTRNTDVNASDGDTELQEELHSSLSELQSSLHRIKQKYPDQKRIILIPAEETQVEELVRWMDAVRRSTWELYEEVVLAAEGNAPEGNP